MTKRQSCDMHSYCTYVWAWVVIGHWYGYATESYFRYQRSSAPFRQTFARTYHNATRTLLFRRTFGSPGPPGNAVQSSFGPLVGPIFCTISMVTLIWLSLGSAIPIADDEEDGELLRLPPPSLVSLPPAPHSPRSRSILLRLIALVRLSVSANPTGLWVLEAVSSVLLDRLAILWECRTRPLPGLLRPELIPPVPPLRP